MWQSVFTRVNFNGACLTEIVLCDQRDKNEMINFTEKGFDFIKSISRNPSAQCEMSQYYKYNSQKSLFVCDYEKSTKTQSGYNKYQNHTPPSTNLFWQEAMGW